MLPDQILFPHFAQREAPWLLHRQLAGPARIATLRRGAAAPLLTRPGVREVAAHCGDGWLHPHQLLPLADPLFAFGREHELMRDRASEAAFDMACVAEWRMFTLSFAGWADKTKRSWWRALQLSRPGGNLVLQLNFPGPYMAAFSDLFPKRTRSQLEFYGHPVRRDGPITLAWARLDLDAWGEDVLIEELQTDWLRHLKHWRQELMKRCTRFERNARRAFIDMTLERYGRDWSRALLLAVLVFATRELGAARVWMHQPDPGAKLKNIRGELPPRSLYTDLPRRFGFAPTNSAPEFLYKARPKAVARLRRSGKPLFWCLEL